MTGLRFRRDRNLTAAAGGARATVNAGSRAARRSRGE